MDLNKRFDNALALAAAYVPHLRYDKAEPFSPEGIGYTIFRETGKSPSSSRIIEVPQDGAVIEYAFYYDFDIQHLYDLEHSFVYLDESGKVTGVESSFHGFFLNSMIEGVLEFEGTHPVLYVQPGKHAFLPSPDYFKLLIDRDEACSKNAGEAGFLVTPMFEGRLFTDKNMDRKVEEYIRRKYAFTPVWEFGTESPDGRKEREILMPYQELDQMIVERLSHWVCRIEEENAERRGAL